MPTVSSLPAPHCAFDVGEPEKIVQSVAAPVAPVARGTACGVAAARAGATVEADPANRLTAPPNNTASIVLTTARMPSAYPLG